MQKLIFENKKMSILTTSFILIGQIFMLYFFITIQKTYNWLTYLQLIGIITGAFYAQGMFLNKAKLMGICGFIFNVITAITMFHAHLWGLFIIRIYGVLMTMYLIICGKDNYQSKISYKKEIYKIISIIMGAAILYYLNGFEKTNILIIVFDFLAVIILTVALFFHSNQSIKQYHWWFASNLCNLIVAILKGNIYLVVVFLFWWVMDNINWLNWKKVINKGQNNEY